MSDEKKLRFCTSLASMADHFGNVVDISDQNDLSTKVEMIKKQSKKLSAARHRELIMNEGKAISESVDMLMEELDHVLAERQSYNDLLQKRADVWDVAAKRFQLMKQNTEEHSTFSCGSASVTGDSSQSCSSAMPSNGDLQVSTVGSDVADVECVKGDSNGPKPPLLSDFNFSKETLEFLQDREPVKTPAAPAGPSVIPKPPRLEDYKFHTINMFESGSAARRMDANQSASLLVLKPPEMPVLFSAKKPAANIEISKAGASDSFEKHNISDHHARLSGDSKRSAGSLAGSFIEDHPIGDGVVLPHDGPLVRSGFGFDDKYFFDESTATTLPSASVAPMSSKKPELAEASFVTKYDSVRKPAIPDLRTICFDSPLK